jgi:outer membrane protein assembly factor BamB
VADEDFIYVPTSNGRLYSFLLPRLDIVALQERGLVASDEKISKIYEKGRLSTNAIGPLSQVMEASRSAPTTPQPVQSWEMVTGNLELPPLITSDTLLAVKPDGTAEGIFKRGRDRASVAELYRFAADGPILVSPAQFGEMGYIGSQDANVYALNINTGRVVWRYTAGQPISREPVALERDLYVTAETNGLTRLDREGGFSQWRVARGNRVLESNTEADRFLTANGKFVYATDRSGRLLVLDRRLGHKLSYYDTRDFAFPVVNDYTDRLYLASNHGLIVCLADKEYPTPLRHRKLDTEAYLPLAEKLAKPISDPGIKSPGIPLNEVLDGLRTKHNLRIVFSEPRFQEVLRDSPGGVSVSYGKVDNQPLGTFLQQILAKVKATYEIVGETIVVVPEAKGK